MNWRKMNSRGNVPDNAVSRTVTMWENKAVRVSRKMTNTIGRMANGTRYIPEMNARDMP